MKIIISRVEQSTTIILNFPGELLPALQADVHEEQGGLLHHLHRLQVVIDSGDDNVDDVYFVKLYNFSNCVVNVLIPMLLLSLLNLAIYQVTIDFL